MRGPGESYSEVIPATGERLVTRFALVVDAERPRLLALGKLKREIGQPSPCFATSPRDDRLTQFGVRRSDILSGRRMLDVLAILQDLDFLQSDEPARHH
jgi:hypothetical protein